MAKKNKDRIPIIDGSNIDELIHQKVNGKPVADRENDLKKRKNLPDEIAKRKAKK